MIYIIGHTKPDLDSAVSAVSLQYLFDQADCFQRKNAKAVLASKANHETKAIFAKFNTSLPPVLKTNQIKADDTFVLVDHNEKCQRLKGIKDEQITDIFDHHKAKLDLPAPIFINTKDWGSSNTIVYWFMEIVKVRPKKNLASLMISAILSDTVGFKSPITTKKDKSVVKELNKIAQIKNIDKLTFEIFKTKSDISGLSPSQLLTKDYKIYDFNGKKVLINQLETVEQEKLTKQSVQLIKELGNLKKKMSLNHVFCLITDVLKVNSKCFVLSEDEGLLKKAFPKAEKLKDGLYNLGPIMSRKKEVAPPIEKAISL